MPVQITRKIGRNRGKPRLWIEGKALIEAGFDHGTPWNLEVTAPGLIIHRDPEGSRRVAVSPVDQSSTLSGHPSALCRDALACRLPTTRTAAPLSLFLMMLAEEA